MNHGCRSCREALHVKRHSANTAQFLASAGASQSAMKQLRHDLAPFVANNLLAM